MAADDGGGGVPNVGSHIALISKSLIRYTGVLYTINMADSTIALQNGPPLVAAGPALRPPSVEGLLTCGMHDGDACAPRSEVARHRGPASGAVHLASDRNLRLYRIPRCESPVPAPTPRLGLGLICSSHACADICGGCAP